MFPTGTPTIKSCPSSPNGKCRYVSLSGSQSHHGSLASGRAPDVCCKAPLARLSRPRSPTGAPVRPGLSYETRHPGRPRLRTRHPKGPRKPLTPPPTPPTSSPPLTPTRPVRKRTLSAELKLEVRFVQVFRNVSKFDTTPHVHYSSKTDEILSTPCPTHGSPTSLRPLRNLLHRLVGPSFTSV